jgi:hypothetical protein
MSTITERHAWRLPRTLLTVFVGWLAVLAGVTVVFEPTEDVVIFGPPERTLALLAGGDTRISDLRPHYAILRGTERGFVRSLYYNGAGLVLPAKNSSCVGLRGRSG